MPRHTQTSNPLNIASCISAIFTISIHLRFLERILTKLHELTYYVDVTSSSGTYTVSHFLVPKIPMFSGAAKVNKAPRANGRVQKQHPSFAQAASGIAAPLHSLDLSLPLEHH